MTQIHAYSSPPSADRTSCSIVPRDELLLRHTRCRRIMDVYSPTVGGMLLFSRTNIYYLTGTRANGLLWFPRHGEPVLMVRKGEERCRLESHIRHIVSFKSYSNIPDICNDVGVPLTPCIGAEMQALPWSLANTLQARLSHYSFIDTSSLLARARSIKTSYELKRLRQSAQLQDYALTQLMAQCMSGQKHASGQISEQNMAHLLWDIYFSLGHGGMLRHENPHVESFLGHIAVGRNSLTPCAFEGVTGTVGTHTAMPFMGSPHAAQNSWWSEHELLMADTGFIHEGYHSQMAFTYFRGAQTHIPAHVQRAYDSSLETMARCHKYVRSGMDMCGIVEHMSAIAPSQTWSLHGIGLSMCEFPAAFIMRECAPQSVPPMTLDVAQEIPFQNGAVLCMAAMSTTPDGLVGTKNIFEVSNEQLVCLGNAVQGIICVE